MCVLLLFPSVTVTYRHLISGGSDKKPYKLVSILKLAEDGHTTSYIVAGRKHTVDYLRLITTNNTVLFKGI